MMMLIEAVNRRKNEIYPWVTNDDDDEPKNEWIPNKKKTRAPNFF